MGRKFKIKGSIYDEDSIAFCRKLSRPCAPAPGAPKSHYVMVLKSGYTETSKWNSTIFLTRDEGSKLMELLSVRAIDISENLDEDLPISDNSDN